MELYEHQTVVDFRFYTKEKRLGNEGFGVVYHVIERATGNNYALKVIKLLANE